MFYKNYVILILYYEWRYIGTRLNLSVSLPKKSIRFQIVFLIVFSIKIYMTLIFHY